MGECQGEFSSVKDKLKLVGHRTHNFELQWLALCAWPRADQKLLITDVTTGVGGEPWFARPPNAKDITVRQLIKHTSGLVRYERNEATHPLPQTVLTYQFTKDLTANPEEVWKAVELVT